MRNFFVGDNFVRFIFGNGKWCVWYALFWVLYLTFAVTPVALLVQDAMTTDRGPVFLTTYRLVLLGAAAVGGLTLINGVLGFIRAGWDAPAAALLGVVCGVAGAGATYFVLSQSLATAAWVVAFSGGSVVFAGLIANLWMLWVGVGRPRLAIEDDPFMLGVPADPGTRAG